jgi:hypothetical protein
MEPPRLWRDGLSEGPNSRDIRHPFGNACRRINLDEYAEFLFVMRGAGAMFGRAHTRFLKVLTN